MIVVNFFAGPGSGKSTTAAGLFFNLKSVGVNAELVTEFAKDLTWAGRSKCIQDQLYLLGKQHNRIHRLKDEVDVVVTDSPILNNLAYAQSYPECFKDTVKWAFDQYDNINFLLSRTKPYNPKGRSQTEEESNEKQLQIRDLLNDNEVEFYHTTGDIVGADFVTQLVLEKFYKKMKKTC